MPRGLSRELKVIVIALFVFGEVVVRSGVALGLVLVLFGKAFDYGVLATVFCSALPDLYVDWGELIDSPSQRCHKTSIVKRFFASAFFFVLGIRRNLSGCSVTAI